MENNLGINKPKKNNKKLINVILAAFAICIVVFTVIGAMVIEKFSTLQQVEELSLPEEDNFKGEIDDRLRFIAMQEDEMGNSPELYDDEKKQDLPPDNMDIPNEPEEIAAFLENETGKKNKFEEYNDKYRKKQYRNNDSTVDEVNDLPYNKEVAISPQDVTLKVVIGDFTTKEAAQEELNQIRSQFTATPFIKPLNGHYTLQVGSFKTQSTAHEFVTSLKQQGFNARIIEE